MDKETRIEELQHELRAAAHVLWALHDAVRNNMQQDELYSEARVWLNVHQALRGDSGFPLPSSLIEKPCSRTYPCPSTTHRIATPQASDGNRIRIVCIACAHVHLTFPPCPHGVQGRKCEHCSPKTHYVDKTTMDEILARERTFIADQQLLELQPGDIVTIYETTTIARRRKVCIRQIQSGPGFTSGFAVAGFSLVPARSEAE